MENFLKKFNILKDDFNKTNLKWKDLMKIKSDYEAILSELEPPAKYLVDIFHKIEDVHSVWYRLKNSDKVVSKIIRKKIKDPSREISLETYKEEITDLIGLRVLHLFKENWEGIHNYIIKNFDLHEDPIAYYREGDSEEYIKGFENYKCKVEKHPYGYRSVHYLIKSKPSKSTYIAEIQVRTIFEEAWSEIDHAIRYPYYLNNSLLNQFLVLFNRLAGSADEMGSFVSRLKSQLEKSEIEYNASIEKKMQIIDELKQEIKDLKLKPKQESVFDMRLDEILTPDYSFPPFTIEPPKFEYPDYSKIFGSDGNTLTTIEPVELGRTLGRVDWSKVLNPKIESTGKEGKESKDETSDEKENKEQQ